VLIVMEMSIAILKINFDNITSSNVSSSTFRKIDPYGDIVSKYEGNSISKLQIVI